MNDRRRILACGSLVLLWASGCAEPCVDDGLIQEPNAECPGLGGDDATDGPEPTTTEEDPAPSCENGIQDGDETDVDCGGSCGDTCGTGQGCEGDDDCLSTECGAGMTCEDPPSCTNAILDGDETDVDCGGPDCDPCDDGDDCLEDSDCSSQQCDAETGTCLAPSCTDGLVNGDETDVDCGGACGATCDPGEDCLVGMDCLSFGCAAGTNVCNDYLSVVGAPSCSSYGDTPVGLVATASGGSGVYTYAWTPNDGSLTTPDQAMTDATPTGFQSYMVTVDDGFATAGDSVVVVSSQPFDLQSNCTTTSANYGVSASGADASISYDMGGMRGCENGNNEFGLTLCQTVVFENTRLRGTLEVLDTGEIPPDNDWVGLVWGAQDDSHFYSMIWKQSFQSGAGFSPPLPCDPPGGILVRRIDAPDFASLTGADFFCVEDTANSTLLADPTVTTTQGWALGESYSVTIDFTDAGSTVTVVRDSDLVEIASFLVTDTTYTTGSFGSTTASQQGACVGPLFAECL